MINEAAFDCWTTHVVLRCVVILLGLLNALGIIQSVQGQNAAESRFAAPATEIEISTGAEPEEVAPRSLSFEMASTEAAPQIPRCIYHPSSRIWSHLSEGDSCTISYYCLKRTFPGPYAYIHHVDYTAERGKDVLITGPDSVRVQEGGGRTERFTDKYEAIPDGIPEGDEEMLCYCSDYRDGPGANEYGFPFLIKDGDKWTVSDVTANESHGNMTFLLEFPQPVARDLTVKYSTKNGTAIAGTDYTRTKGLVTVRKGQTSAYIGVPLVKDQIPEGTETFELLTVSDQFSGIPEQKATGTIVEGSHFVIEPSPLSVDEGGQNTYTIALSEQPGGDVMVAITGYTGTDLALDKTSLTFTPANWDQGQTVTVTAGEDADAIDDRETLMHTATAPGGGFDGVAESLWVAITDKYALRLIVKPNHLDLVEGGSGQAFEVKLGSSPPVGKDATVAVNVGLQLNGKVSLSEPHLTFTSTDWSTDQSVTVTAESDADAADEAGTLELLASGGGYDGQNGSVSVAVDDDESAGLVVAPRLLYLEEGDSGKVVKVKLATPPARGHVRVDMNIHVRSGMVAKVSLSKSSLTFTSSDWSVDQQVEVKAKDDGDAEDEDGYILLQSFGHEYNGSFSRVSVTVDDDDTAQLVVTPTTLSLVEGGSGKGFTVRLGSAPVGNDVTVAVSIPPELAGKVSLTVPHLTFTSSNWSTDQSVTLTAENDGDADNEAGTLDLSASGGGYNGQTGDVSVTVDDDDTAQLVVTPTTLSLVEGGSGKGFTVRLGSAPVGNDVTVAVSIPPELAGKVSLTVPHLTFTSSNWSTDQSVTVTAENDGDADNEAGTLDLSASGGGYNGQTGDVSVTVDDDDTVQLVVAPLTVSLVEGGSGKGFTVRLGSAPVGNDVTVAVSIPPELAGKVSLTVPHLIFTSSNWSTDQSVTVMADDDGDADDEAGTLDLSANGGGYNGQTGDVSVTVDDDDTVQLVVAPLTVSLVEGGSGKDFIVKLGSSPPVGEDVKVAVSVSSELDGEVSLSVPHLIFASSNWSTDQSVTVMAQDDRDAGDEAGTLGLAASGGGYDGINGRVSVDVTDDDTPGLVLSKASLTIQEGSSRDYTVRLVAQPTEAVTVSITGTGVTISPVSLTFTGATWDTEQTVMVMAPHDDDASDERMVLTHAASGGDYRSVSKDLPVMVTDDDTPGLRIAPMALTVPEGVSGMYRVALETEPTGTVTVTIESDNSDVTMVATLLTFTSGDWDMEQTVTVRAVEDADTDDDSATLTHTASGGDYDSVRGPAVTVTVKDDDPVAGLVVSPTYLSVTEGAEEHFTVQLLAEPTQAVDVRITGDAGTGLRVGRTMLRFISEDWSTPVTVTVHAEEDDDVMDASVQLTLTASGGVYTGETEKVVVAVQDNDVAEIVLSATELEIVELDAESYTVRLVAQPSGTVIVTIASDNPEVTVSDASLTFTADDWYTPQAVTVLAHEDDDQDNDDATLVHRASGSDYDGVEEELTVMVLDDDEAGLVVRPQALSLDEGAAGKTFTVSLATPPSGQVTVTLSQEFALDGKVSVVPLGLTFTPADWDTDQTVMVTALDDADGSDEAGLVQLSASGGGYGGKSGAVKVKVTDADAPHSIDIEPSSVQVSEGAGPARFKVRLNRQSETAVAVRYTTHDESAHAGLDYLVPVTNMLTFETGGNLDKWIDVPIIDDALHEEEETFTLELTDAQGAELGNATGRATITDNDAAPTVSIVPAVYVRERGIANVYVSLSNASATPIRVLYSTSDVTATAGEDYEAVSAGSVTIEHGEMGAVIQVPTEDDALHEGREAFLVQLDGGGQTTVTILDDDRLPGLSIGDVTVSEDGGSAQLAVSLNGMSAVRVGVAYATQDGTAKAGADYTRAMGTLVFAPRETMRHIWVPVARDDVVEEDEVLVVRLSAPEHAMLLDAEGDVTIKDDPIEVSIYDGTGAESSDELTMAVRLNYGSTKVVSVQFAVTGGTATSDVDYEATEGLVVFETGSTEAQVRIPLIDDDLQEGNETIEVTLLSPTNAQIGQAMATGTIVDDETALGVQVRAIAVSQSEAVFAVSLLAPVADRLTGRYRTVDGTAWAGEDYERMEGVLEFGPGETRKEVRVPLLRAQGTGEAFALMVELGDETVREDVVLGSKDTGNRARLGRSVAVHIVEAVSERMEGSLVGCMPRPFPGQRVRVSHLLSGCGMQAGGERLSVWGRGAYSRLQSGGISGADVVTASLGADYSAGGRWLMGMVVSRSEALEEEGTLLQMTGWYPYVRYGGMRHSVWGLAGAGQGVVEEAADTGMRMMVAGVGGTLVRRAGARLGYEADGFWLGMDGGIGVSRVRAGLEGSVMLRDILEPYVEAAILHSGGDAERGMGMEAGGGLRVRMGMLHAEVMSRRLVLHQEDGYGEWGYSGTVRYGGLEGLGAQVRPTWGRTHVGTLWQSERPWEVYPSDRRMELEVGYGSRVYRRSVLRPHVGMGLRDRGRDYRIGTGVQGRKGLGFSVSGLAMEHMAPYRPVSYGVTASGYMRW